MTQNDDNNENQQFAYLIIIANQEPEKQGSFDVTHLALAVRPWTHSEVKPHVDKFQINANIL